MQRLLEYQVDSIISDIPTLAKEVLVQHTKPS